MPIDLSPSRSRTAHRSITCPLLPAQCRLPATGHRRRLGAEERSPQIWGEDFGCLSNRAYECNPLIALQLLYGANDRFDLGRIGRVCGCQRPLFLFSVFDPAIRVRSIQERVFLDLVKRRLLLGAKSDVLGLIEK